MAPCSYCSGLSCSCSMCYLDVAFVPSTGTGKGKRPPPPPAKPAARKPAAAKTWPKAIPRRPCVWFHGLKRATLHAYMYAYIYIYICPHNLVGGEGGRAGPKSRMRESLLGGTESSCACNETTCLPYCSSVILYRRSGLLLFPLLIMRRCCFRDPVALRRFRMPTQSNRLLMLALMPGGVAPHARTQSQSQKGPESKN